MKVAQLKFLTKPIIKSLLEFCLRSQCFSKGIEDSDDLQIFLWVEVYIDITYNLGNFQALFNFVGFLDILKKAVLAENFKPMK